MNLDETARLLAEVRAMYPQMTFVPGIADAWHKILFTFALDDCRLALTRHASSESRIPAPADVRRACLAARQDTAMRALPSHPDDLIPMPDWYRTTAAEHRTRQHALNVQRKADGLLPTFGETITRPSDHRP